MGDASTAVASGSWRAHKQQQQHKEQLHLECPFCQFHDSDEYALLLHIEALHTEDSPFVVRGDPDSTSNDVIGSHERFNPLDYEFGLSAEDEETTYVLCPEPGCGEPVLLMELQTHLDLHDAEKISMEDVRHRDAEEYGNGSSGSSSGSSSGKETVLVRDTMLMERQRSGKESGRPEKENGGSSRSSSGTRNWEREIHGERGREGEGGRGRDRGRGKERDRDRGVSYRVIYPDSGSSSPSVVSTKHRSPKRFFRPSFSLLQHKVTSGPSSTRGHERSRARSNAVNPYKDSEVKRLGKSDLGPYAHEKQMPDWLRKELEKGGKVSMQTRIDGATGTLINVVSVSNETPGLLPVIAILCERDPNVARAWLCHPGVKHVGKQIQGEGGFCGYRNIQMVISYIQAAFPRGSHQFEERIPSILKIQDWIEEGWSKGINVSARLETGGIKGTRKYIGSSEAQTMFISLGISCRPYPFNRSEGLQTQHNLLDFVESYFQSDTTQGPIISKVARTHKPPIYFQHSGHSMTIVGIEKTLNGMRNLLVFDPYFTPSAPMKNLTGVRALKGRLDSEILLRAYRRRLNYLQKYKDFELIVLEV